MAVDYFFQSDIMDVNQIFKDLGMLVHEQGEVLGMMYYNAPKFLHKSFWANSADPDQKGAV